MRPPIWEGDFLCAGDFELTDTDEISKINLVSEETPGPQHSDGRFGLLLSERGGCTYADHTDVPYLWTHGHDPHKRQKPPLGQVTVS